MLARCLSRAGIVLALLLAAGFAPAVAGPLAPPGDARMRQDVELLKSFGYMVGPADAWPLPWAQIDRGIDAARADGALAPILLRAVERLEALSDRNQNRIRYELDASFTNEPALVRGFAVTGRNAADVRVSAAHDVTDDLTIEVGASWISDGTDRQRATRHGNGFSPDPSQISWKIGNWMFYGGWPDTYWGSGVDGALLFSTSARAFPRIGFRRLQPYSIDAPVLRWLGPVTFDMFVGIADEKRDFDNPAVVGMRLAFQPTRYFEIGLQRGLMLCGSGRPCDFNTIGRALLGAGNFDNTGSMNEPGNQVGGFEMSYRRPIGTSGHALRLSFDTVAEDADNILIEQFARQIGVGVLGPVGTSGASYWAGVEYADTLGQRFFGHLQGGDLYPGSIYNHFIYTDGWTYGRRPLGFSLDGDTKLLTLHASLTDVRNRRWYGSYRHADLNFFANPRYRISHSHEKISIWTGGLEWPTRLGDVRLEGRVQKNAPDTPDSSPWRVQGEFGWTSRF
jgi:hypothetical protein